MFMRLRLRPAFFAQKRDKADIGNIFCLELILVQAGNSNELLGARISADGKQKLGLA